MLIYMWETLHLHLISTIGSLGSSHLLPFQILGTCSAKFRLRFLTTDLIFDPFNYDDFICQCSYSFIYIMTPFDL